MLIYPAIDIRGGRCVRLTQGLFEKEKVYFENPEEVAQMWQEKGAKALHIVDLDGALEGESKNLSVIQKVVKSVNIPVQVGGGIRSINEIEGLLAIGIKKVILGTKALHDREFMKETVDKFPGKIIVSIDAKDGYVAVDGWTKTSQVTVDDFVKDIEEIGVKTIVYTDISRDGMMQGPNFEGIRRLKQMTGIKLIASGGISSIDDLKRLKEMDVEGAIVGKALYEGRIDLQLIEGAL